MQWEQLTATEFARAVKKTQTCILTMGVVEKHSEHLPLGTDYLNAHRIAVLAAQREPAVVFPPFYFGQIYEARCFPGTIALKPALLLKVADNVLDEIGRNGFRKIIIYNGHGGNNYFVHFLAQTMLAEEKPYTVYVFQRRAEKKIREGICETDVHGHACECETSISLANHPELVKMDQVPKEPGVPLARGAGLREDNYSAIGWYSMYPDHYAGDARSSSVEKGLALLERRVAQLAKYIKTVKEDTLLPNLEREFYEKVNQLP